MEKVDISMYDKFGNKESNVKETKVRNTKDYLQISNMWTLESGSMTLLSGLYVRIRFSKLLANLDENSSSVSLGVSLSQLAL